MIKYFDELFSGSNTEWEAVIDCMTNNISRVQNEEMMSVVEEVKVKNALFSMHPNKSPRPDDMSPGFYQKFWRIVGIDVVQIVNFFLILVLLTCSSRTPI